MPKTRLIIELADDLNFFCKELEHFGFYTISNVYVIKKEGTNEYIKKNKAEIPLYFKQEEEAQKYIKEIYLNLEYVKSKSKQELIY